MPNSDSYKTTPGEARRIFRAVFGGEAPPAVVERFVVASDRLNDAAGEAEVAEYYEVLDRVDDLEALEVASRYRRTLPLLSAKFRIVVYVAETVPELQDRFVNHRNNVVGAVWAVVAGGMRTAYKLAKGNFLMSRGHDA